MFRTSRRHGPPIGYTELVTKYLIVLRRCTYL